VRTSILPTSCRESVAILGRAGAALQQERHDRHLERCAHEPARHFLLRRVADALEDEFLIRVFTEAHLRQLGGRSCSLSRELDEIKATLSDEADNLVWARAGTRRRSRP
jgi:hypothetical protein